MRFQKAKSICQLPATACTAMLLLVATAAPVKEGAVGNMDQLASDLASERYAVREKASDLLWKMGTSALPTLRQLTKSRDPEQAIRARELVRKIELGVYPDSDPELLAIIERYPKALPSEKKNLLDELNSRQAWRQMLKLYQDETNEMILTEHLRMMERIAVAGALGALGMNTTTRRMEWKIEARADLPGVDIAKSEKVRVNLI